MRSWAFAKIRLISYVRPSVLDLTDERCEIVVPLSWRTRNHLRSMYFGALCTGADAAAALIGLNASRKAGGRIAIVFKDMQAEFVKRAEDDVHFVVEQGREILKLGRKGRRLGRAGEPARSRRRHGAEALGLRARRPLHADPLGETPDEVSSRHGPIIDLEARPRLDRSRPRPSQSQPMRQLPLEQGERTSAASTSRGKVRGKSGAPKSLIFHRERRRRGG